MTSARQASMSTPTVLPRGALTRDRAAASDGEVLALRSAPALAAQDYPAPPGPEL